MDPTRQKAARRDTQGQWSRAIWLDTETRAGSYPSIPALQDKFEVSRRTAFNTVAFLRDSWALPSPTTSSAAAIITGPRTTGRANNTCRERDMRGR